MVEEKLLKDLTEIRSGHHFRFKLKNDPSGDIEIIQLGDISNDGLIVSDHFLRIKRLNIKSDDFLRQNDIIFKAKSKYRVATVFNESPVNTIVSAHYFILSLKSNIVSSEFLAWYLNSDMAQGYFDKNARGTRIPIINKVSLGNLKVSIPSREIQQKIVELNKLCFREGELLDQLKKKRELLVKSSLQEVINR